MFLISMGIARFSIPEYMRYVAKFNKRKFSIYRRQYHSVAPPAYFRFVYIASSWTT